MGLYVGYDPVNISVGKNNRHFNYYKKPPTLAASYTWYKGTTAKKYYY